MSIRITMTTSSSSSSTPAVAYN